MHLSVDVRLNSGKKSSIIWWRGFFLVFTWIWGKSVPFLVKRFILGGFTWIWGKNIQFLVKTFFLWSLNLLTWTNSWSRVIHPMLKMGQSWSKIVNYPLQCLTKIGTPESKFINLKVKTVNYYDDYNNITNGKNIWSTFRQKWIFWEYLLNIFPPPPPPPRKNFFSVSVIVFGNR